jgi:predicted Ser/Thr protein kinase
VIEFIDGSLIGDFISAPSSSLTSIRKVVFNLLDQLHALDSHGIEKLELTRPVKHIIVRHSDSVPVQIDFERARYSEHPSNVTQFLQFLSSGRFREILKLDKKTIITLGKEYKETYTLANIKKYLMCTIAKRLI